MDIFDNISPLDYRYYLRDKAISDAMSPYLSENARIKYQLKVETAFIQELEKRKMLPKGSFKEVEQACEKVTAKEVYEEEDRIRHDIRALVNLIRNNVNPQLRPLIHLGLTSNDVINTAESLRYKDFSLKELLPSLKKLMKTIIAIAEREKDTVQIGRTHGQHAVTITFGFAMAEYVSRLGGCIKEIERAADDLRGKVSGAVGAYNALSLCIKNPADFEREVLAVLGLKPATHSTQILEPEYALRLFSACMQAFGVIANLADDMRHLQRSEIGEVGETTAKGQVGSSTMPHKKNPITFENIKSLWKSMAPRMLTAYMDQISEHQRDLTNSASSRFYPEMLAGLYIAAVKAEKAMARLAVDREACRKNLEGSKGLIVAEPLYILLAFHGHPDAHEAVRILSSRSRETGKSITKLLEEDRELRNYYNKFSEGQKQLLENPEKYTGLATEKAQVVCSFWRKELNL